MNDKSTECTHTLVSHLVLASSSPRRKELVASLDLSLPVSIFSVEVDEFISPTWKPADAVELLSLSKAEAVIQAIHNGAAPNHISSEASLILAADTIVVLDGQILGKPSSKEDAFLTLKRLQGRCHQVYSGLVLMPSNRKLPYNRDEAVVSAFGSIGKYGIISDKKGQITAAYGHSVSQVTFRPMSDEEIEAYVLTGEPMDKAGSYGIQGKGAVFVEKLEGDFFSVMGLPINMLHHLLSKFGVIPFYRNEKG